MKKLLLDIETAPMKGYIWDPRTRYIPSSQIFELGYTMCWSAKWVGQSKVYFSSTWDDGDQYMFEYMAELLNEADAVIHYNGNKFDVPTLNWEFLKMDIAPPDAFHSIDVFRTVKQRFKLPYYGLDFVAKELGLGSKLQHKGMELWEECMAGDKKAHKIMEKYNVQDVRLLEKVYKRVLPWIKNHPNHALYTEDTRPICTNCGSHHVVKCGTETTKTQTYQRYRCQKCHTPLRGRFATTLDKDKKQGILVQA